MNVLDKPIIKTDLKDGEFGLEHKEIIRLEQQLIDYFDDHGLLVNIFLAIRVKDKNTLA